MCTEFLPLAFIDELVWLKSHDDELRPGVGPNFNRSKLFGSLWELILSDAFTAEVEPIDWPRGFLQESYI